MGYGANYADVIEDADVAKVCPNEHKKLMSLIEKYGIDLEVLASAVASADTPLKSKRNSEKIMKAYDKLVEAFGKKYKGAGLSLSYHDSQDQGDRYDDVNGAYWFVDGMYELTPIGKKLNHMVSRKMFVTFG